MQGQSTVLEHMLQDNMLDDLYHNGLGFAQYNTYLARMMQQITHRYPHAKILEIGEHCRTHITTSMALNNHEQALERAIQRGQFWKP